MKPHPNSFCEKTPKKGNQEKKEQNKKKMWASSSMNLVKNLRWTSIVLGVTNFWVIIIGSLLVRTYGKFCSCSQFLPFLLVMATAGVQIMSMIRCAIEQQAAATAVLGCSPEVAMVPDNPSRLQRRLRYKKWLWWTRFATIVTMVQFVLVMYLMFVVSRDASSTSCALVSFFCDGWWKKHLLVVFLITVCFIATLQCFASSDVLRWRSFYDMQDTAWKAHYQEVFDHGIREALCCLGRVKYMGKLEEDEVNLVAQLLGDLVTYRASGTGHLEILAGLALLQMHNQTPILHTNSIDAPIDKIQEATAFYPFAEAAYTGPLLDVGRNPFLFPCTWLYRQGVFTPWSRKRRPLLHGDNWWRGHAAAFLKYVNISQESLRCGRVSRGKCQAAYFIVVLHDIRSVVIAIRGTETPEDLITDGLCRETTLTMEDIDGLINGKHIDPSMRRTILSSNPHYGHSGIVESARELYHQIGGAYSDLHVYAYGPLPCMDPVIADACSSIITSIVHDSEFSSFLSVNSILRLRAAALTTLSHSDRTSRAVISKLAQLFLYVSKNQNGEPLEPLPTPVIVNEATQSFVNNNICGNQSHFILEGKTDLENYVFLQDESYDKEVHKTMALDLLEGFTDSIVPDENLVGDPISRFLEAVTSSVCRSPGDPPEVFLPGLIIHLIRTQRGTNFSFVKGWGAQEMEQYRAIIAERENFKEMLISPSMFLDHLPWRCQYALQRVWESRKININHDNLPMV